MFGRNGGASHDKAGEGAAVIMNPLVLADQRDGNNVTEKLVSYYVVFATNRIRQHELAPSIPTRTPECYNTMTYTLQTNKRESGN